MVRWFAGLLLLSACGRDPVAPEPKACAIKPSWAYTTPAGKALGLPDSVLVSSSVVCP